MPMKVYLQLLVFYSIVLEVVPLAPIPKVLGQSSVLSVIPIYDEADCCSVDRELLIYHSSVRVFILSMA